MSGLDSSYYEELQGQLRAILIVVETSLDREEAELVDEMIDANECGIALEMISDLLFEKNAQVESETVVDIGRLVAKMQLPLRLVEQLEKSPPTS